MKKISEMTMEELEQARAEADEARKGWMEFWAGWATENIRGCEIRIAEIDKEITVRKFTESCAEGVADGRISQEQADKWVGLLKSTSIVNFMK